MGLFNKNEVKEISISVNDQYVIWNVDLNNISRNCMLDVGAGCTALYIVNGAINAVEPAGRWVINSKQEQKNKSQLKLIGINTDKTFDILCGVGDIPYKDYEINAETTVGVRGESKVKLIQPWQVYNALGKDNLTADEVNEYIRGKLSEIMSNTLATLLQKYEYSTINTQLSNMSETIQDKWSEACLACGLQSVSFTLNTIFFSEEFIAKRQAYFDNINRRKEAKLDRRERDHEMRNQEEMLQAAADAQATVNKSLPNNNANGSYSSGYNRGYEKGFENGTNTKTNAPVSKFCVKCGMALSDDVVFCPQCGTRRK